MTQSEPNSIESSISSLVITGSHEPQSGPGTPTMVRAALLGAVVLLTITAYLTHETIGQHGRAMIGIVVFLLLAAAVFSNLRAVNWKTIGWGIALQVVLALAVTKLSIVQDILKGVGVGIKVLIDC